MALREEQAELRGLVRRFQLLPGPLGPFELRERAAAASPWARRTAPRTPAASAWIDCGRLAAHEAVELADADVAVSRSSAARAICACAARSRTRRQRFPLVSVNAWRIPAAAASTFPWNRRSSDRPGWG